MTARALVPRVDPARACFLALALVACAAPLEPRRPDGKPHLTVATFNVYFPAWRDEATVRAVGATNADVVLLQEVDPGWEDVLRERYASRYAHLLFQTRGGSRGLAVLSRYPVEDGGIVVAPARGFHFAWILHLDTPMGRVQALNLHLRSALRGSGSALENYFSMGSDHGEEVRSFVAHLSGEPTIVVGDFNEGPDGPSLAWLERRGFRNALPLFHPGQPTWRGRSVAAQFQMSIDHVLFDGTFEPLDAYVVQEGNSDHFPVVAWLTSASRPQRW